MDSITQAALGAAVGTAVLGRSRPVWQAALTGAVLGTLPDLDVFIDKGDAIRDMVLHRAETHAFFWQAVVSPVFAAALALVTRSRELFWRWWAMVLLVLFTHAALDALTIYGTRIGLPFTNYPVGLGSLFIIDPLYTLPLVLGVMLTLAVRHRHRWRWNTAGLALSTLYAAWAVTAQHHVTELVLRSPQAAGLSAQQVLVTPTPFNTMLWRIVLMREDHYAEGFYSLLDPLVEPGREIRFTEYPRDAALDRRTADFNDANLIREFSKGFYALSGDDHRIRITDLRMGQYPYYAFSFVFAEHHSEPVVPITPERITRRLPLDPGLTWLWERLKGSDTAPPG